MYYSSLASFLPWTGVFDVVLHNFSLLCCYASGSYSCVLIRKESALTGGAFDYPAKWVHGVSS